MVVYFRAARQGGSLSPPSLGEAKEWSMSSSPFPPRTAQLEPSQYPSSPRDGTDRSESFRDFPPVVRVYLHTCDRGTEESKGGDDITRQPRADAESPREENARIQTPIKAGCTVMNGRYWGDSLSTRPSKSYRRGATGGNPVTLGR